MAEYFNAPPTTQSLEAISRVPLDPTLDSCCQREIEATSAKDAALSAVRSKDKIFEKQRLIARENDKIRGRCACCFVERLEGEDYPVLAGLRAIRFAEAFSAQAQTDLPSDRPANAVDSDSDDSDSDFDDLLDDLPASFTSQLEEQQTTLALLHAHGFGNPLSLSPTSLPSAISPLVAGEHVPTVIHLYDPTLTDSAHLDLHLECLASEHPGTRFFRVDGTALFNNPYPQIQKLRELFRLTSSADVPALIALRGGIVENVSQKLEAFGTIDRTPSLSPNFPSSPTLSLDAVSSWLNSSNVLAATATIDVARLCAASVAVRESLAKAQEKALEDADLEERFDCGMNGCCKTFVHQHIGAEGDGQTAMLRDDFDAINF